MKRSILPLLFLLGVFQIAEAQSTIFLVRHAEKSDAGSGDPKDPELSDLGRIRTESLRKTLQDAAITTVYATEYKRTQQTAAAVATAAGIPITTVATTETAALIAKLKEMRGNALVVGHSNTLPQIIKAVGSTVPVVIDEGDYDDLFVMILSSPPKIVHLHYR